MSIIYLARHGETEWNKEKIFRGTIDIPLSEQGKKEAVALAEYLKEEQIQFIYSSPLLRAKQTARALAEKFDLEVKIEPGVIDLNFGSWQGKSIEQVKELDPEGFELWEKSPEKIIFPGGESLAQARARAMEALERIAENHPEEKGVVVSHRVICKLVVLSALGADESGFWRVQQDLACYNILEKTEAGWKVWLLNHTCHLKNLPGHLRTDF